MEDLRSMTDSLTAEELRALQRKHEALARRHTNLATKYFAVLVSRDAAVSLHEAECARLKAQKRNREVTQ